MGQQLTARDRPTAVCKWFILRWKWTTRFFHVNELRLEIQQNHLFNNRYIYICINSSINSSKLYHLNLEFGSVDLPDRWSQWAPVRSFDSRQVGCTVGWWFLCSNSRRLKRRKGAEKSCLVLRFWAEKSKLWGLCYFVLPFFLIFLFRLNLLRDVLWLFAEYDEYSLSTWDLHKIYYAYLFWD